MTACFLFDIDPAISMALSDPTRLLFITGPAGSGKSTCLQTLNEQLDDQVAVLAPSGLAALNVGGQTIHSFFGLPPSYITKDDAAKIPPPEVCRDVSTIIIDEVSMVRPDVIAAIDIILKNAHSSSLPFGGVQMIAFGDMGQLPPVIKHREMRSLEHAHGGLYWFHTAAVKNHQPRGFRFQKIYRQSDLEFIAALNALRTDRLKNDHLDLLNSRVGPGQDATTLVPTNDLANEINRQRLLDLPGWSRRFPGLISGNFQELPTEKDLELKEGALVCMLNNDPRRRWVNGTLAHVSRIDESFDGKQECFVEINGEEHLVEPYQWENFRYRPGAASERELGRTRSGSFEQLPLKLAWAMTIHKSQGMTLDRVHIDFGRGTFAHGQAYVALSRCRTLDGLTLARPITLSDVRIDQAAFGYRDFFEVLS